MISKDRMLQRMCESKHAVMQRKVVRSSFVGFVKCRECQRILLRGDVALWNDPMWECSPYCRECA